MVQVNFKPELYHDKHLSYLRFLMIFVDVSKHVASEQLLESQNVHTSRICFN